MSLPLHFLDELMALSTFDGVDDWWEDTWLPKALEMMTGGVE